MSTPMDDAPLEQEPDLYFANAHDFVVQYLLPSWRHTYSGARWCAQWWCHAEALSRLDALWRAFESMRHGDAAGMAVWWSMCPVPGRTARGGGSTSRTR